MYTDEQRLKFIMQDLDSYFKVSRNRHEYAYEVANDNFHDEPTELDELEGFRRMVDDAMVAYNFSNKNI